ncbi:hypothetical protein SNOG_06002 [Parastagonospora nodorum SN15]|uniref:Uncharacterized protein n=1 Tax=Phaeosphaeria nodorum (strain SN15 / ATCC MYA-4574 / FGSC 10173) TaxID=321614 RepID=Q0UQG2_PHANO|nr:hypothetical protein SNOG_06002 [Parastagonospora nodorum SN15]EAT87066.2 hypothetical protein SNOG_06002 [Parastagonospora nodorum SN15]
MSLTEKEPSPSPIRRQSDDAKKPTNDGKIGPNEARSGMNPYFRIFTYADALSWTLNIVAFVAAIAAGVLLPLMNLVFGKFVTSFTGFGTGAISAATYRADVNKFTLYFIYLFVAKFALVYIHSVCISIAAIRTTKALRVDFIKHILRQNIAYFDSESIASVTTQATTNGNNASNGISEKLSMTIQAVSTFVSAFVVAFTVQWKLTLITICVVPTIVVVVGICVTLATKHESRQLEIYSTAGLLAEEVFSSIRTVHAFWLNPLLLRKFDKFLDEAMVVGMKLSPVFAVLFSTEFFCVYSAYGLAFWQGIRMYFSGEIRESGDVKSEIDPLNDEGIVPETCDGVIEIKDITFAYPARADTTVLNGLTLSAPARQTTALVGASGSGKSTVIGLLVYENVASGLFGTDKANLPEVEQRALIEKACKDAYADEFIAQLPKGYDTQLGERAMNLSGGQKQRIAIARSIVSEPTVLLLDEATSALDPKAEKIVQQALDRVSRNRTTIVIAHKLSTIRTAENIAVIANGAVVEQGAHEELLKLDEAYARLVNAQDLGQAEGDEVVAEEKTAERIALVRTQTQTQGAPQVSIDSKKNGADINLISCIFIVLKEQSHLWKLFIILAIATIAGGAAYPAQAILFSRVIGAFQLSPSEGVDQGDFYSLMFFIIAIGILMVFATVGWVSNIVAQHVSRRYRHEIFELIAKQDMAFFDDEANASGALASNLSNYPNNMAELLGFNIMLIGINIVNILSSSILAIVVGWKLGLAVVFGAMIPIVFSGYLRIRLEFKLEEDTGKRFASSAALASEAVSAIRTVSSLALERHILDKYQGRLQGVARKSIKALVWTMFWYSLTQSISFLAMALGFWYGGQLISNGEYTTTQFFIVFIGVIFSGEAAAQFFSYTSSLTKSATAANYIFRLRRQQPAVQEDSSKPPFEGDDAKGPAHIEVQNVAFAYESRPHAKVLEGINIDARPGQFIALVGASGCGKSTMISLLERFYDPVSGCISCDGANLQHLCPRKYRRDVALVQQEPVLYQGSVRDNIAMGMETDVTDAQVEAAAKQSNISDFVASLPEGFATMCGSRGTQLSGGQRQRIAIARALIREPRLLLLDEATSALDTESERVVQAALEQAQSGRTTVAVAHRLSTIKGADLIMVFARGKILEIGTHQELLSKRGVYYEMCLGQSLDRSIPA